MDRFGTTSRQLAIATALLIVSGPALAGDAGHGLELAQQWCNACHSIGTDVPRQEDAGPIWSDFTDTSDAFLIGAMSRRHDFMPEFPQLTDTDKADLAEYIRSLQ